jgi:type IV pilus assembly protein PilE
MALRIAVRPGRPSGFTLVELMVVVAIATILFAIAIPSYMSYVRQSRRTEARTAVLDLAGREERFFSTNGAVYTSTANALGYGTAAVALTNFAIGSNYYQLTVCVATAAGTTPPCDPNANAPTAPSYYVTATPVATQTQATDAQCTSFSVDSTGQQFATGTGGTTYCWAN